MTGATSYANFTELGCVFKVDLELEVTLQPCMHRAFVARTFLLSHLALFPRAFPSRVEQLLSR